MKTALLISSIACPGSIFSQVASDTTEEAPGDFQKIISLGDTIAPFSRVESTIIGGMKPSIKNDTTQNDSLNNLLKFSGNYNPLGNELELPQKDASSKLINFDTLKKSSGEKIAGLKGGLSDRKSKVKNFNSMALVKKELKKIKPTGSISAGYEYGIIPYVVGGNYPSGGFRSTGNISFLLLDLPLELNYYYTNIRNVVGLNNYFRLSYDADRYKDQLRQKLNDKEKLSAAQLTKLQLQQQGLLQKMDYMSYLKLHPDYKTPKSDSLKGLKTPLLPIATKDSLSLPNDSIALSADKFNDSLKNYNSYIPVDSSKRSADAIKKKDSLTTEINEYKVRYDSIQNEIAKIKKASEQIKTLKENPSSIANPYMTKVQSFLSGIKKLEIGLCHPSYSTFLVSNVPLQGLNMEYSKNDNFIAFTYGTTLNNLQYNTNTLQGAVQGAHNLYNYFDFSNLSGGRKILCVKGGIGQKDDSHLYAGFLVGKGRTDYLYPETAYSSFARESNVVI
ncbi:MAG TPA: hypothetical protein VGC65_02490, partial [Bacteroidia bacterium]